MKSARSGGTALIGLRLSPSTASAVCRGSLPWYAKLRPGAAWMLPLSITSTSENAFHRWNAFEAPSCRSDLADRLVRGQPELGDPKRDGGRHRRNAQYARDQPCGTPQLTSRHRRRAGQGYDPGHDYRARRADDEREDYRQQAADSRADEVGPVENPCAGRVPRQADPDYRAREEERHCEGQVVECQVS